MISNKAFDRAAKYILGLFLLFTCPLLLSAQSDEKKNPPASSQKEFSAATKTLRNAASTCKPGQAHGRYQACAVRWRSSGWLQTRSTRRRQANSI